MGYRPNYYPGTTAISSARRRSLKNNLEPLRPIEPIDHRSSEMTRKEILRRWKKGRLVKTDDDLVLMYVRFLRYGAFPLGLHEAELRAKFKEGEVRIIYGNIDDDIAYEMRELGIEVLFLRRLGVVAQVWCKQDGS